MFFFCAKIGLHEEMSSAEPASIAGHVARVLTVEEVTRLQKDKIIVSDFKQSKLEKEAEKNWDLFYKRNTTKFFKDRHWTKREFEELLSDVNIFNIKVQINFDEC